MSSPGHRREPAQPTASAVDLEILRTTLIAYTAELASVLANAAPIAEISQAKAFSVAIADASGGIAAIDNPLDLGSVAQTVASILDYFEFDLKDGDVVVTNDPYAGGTRVQDVTLLAPLVAGTDVILHLIVRVPLRDIGGQVSGSLFPTASELMAEGVPVTPIKLQRQGRPARDTLGTLLLNSRRGEESGRVLDAAGAILALGRERLAEMIAARGADTIRSGLDYAQRYGEQRARAAIGNWRDGTYAGSATLAHEPSGAGPLSVKVAATVADGALTLDFGDSDDQRSSFVNSSSGSTASSAVRAVLAFLGDGVPANSGMLRAVRVVTRPGSVTHPVPPAPVGGGPAHCGAEVIEAVASALRPAAGTPVPALSGPRPLVLSRPADDRSDHVDLGRVAVSGAGATDGADGWGPPLTSTRAQLPSVEQWEPESGMVVRQLEYAIDTAGAGQWAGAPGVEAVVELPADRRYTLWSQPAAVSAAGLDGAYAGRPGECAFHTDEGWEPAPAVAIEEAVDGDLVLLRLPGGGGYGPPGARSDDAVRRDLADGLISAAVARDVYGLSEEEIAQIGTVHHV